MKSESLSQPQPTPEKVDRESYGALIQKLFNGPVHGSGYAPFTPEERTKVEVFLSIIGSRLDDPVLEHLKGETLLDLREYVQAEPFSDKRRAVAQIIQDAYKVASKEYYKEA